MAGTMSELQGSPEMKYARSRLGNLLQGIRENTAAGIDADGPDANFGELDDEFRADDYASPRKTPGRKRGRKERKVLFELRGKPFELRDNQREESLFSLCRTWVQGREFYPSTTGIADHHLPAPPPIPGLEAEPIEVQATKEIHQLPGPDAGVALLTRSAVRPSEESSEPVDVDTSSRQSLLASYLPHWKAVKRTAMRESGSRSGRYAESLGLLRAVHAVHAHNAIVAAQAAAV